MANMQDCMVRNLKRFVEYELYNCVRWPEVRVSFPDEQGVTAKNPDGNRAVAEFTIGGKMHEVYIESSEANPIYSCGSVFLDGVRIGPIDEKTWTDIGVTLQSAGALALEGSK